MPSITTSISFAAVGHVTNDRLEGGLVPGGSALYAALTAARLGCQARICTSFGDDFSGAALLAEAGITVDAVPAPRTTTFENRYTGGRREQRVTAIASPIDHGVAADVVFVCPVVDEVAPQALAGDLVGAGLQGWMRRIDEDGRVHRRPLEDVAFLAPCRAVFCSDEDLGDDAARLTLALVRVVSIVAVTHGARGATLYVDGKAHHVAAHPAEEVDPTGAGDVFATAFLIALARGDDPLAAARHAAACAAVVVEAVGPSALTRPDGRLQWRIND